MFGDRDQPLPGRDRRGHTSHRYCPSRPSVLPFVCLATRRLRHEIGLTVLGVDQLCFNCLCVKTSNENSQQLLYLALGSKKEESINGGLL